MCRLRKAGRGERVVRGVDQLFFGFVRTGLAGEQSYSILSGLGVA